MRDGGFAAFGANLAALPVDSASVIIRSLFAATSPVAHPQQVPGYASTQLLQRIGFLTGALNTGSIRSYAQLVTAGAIQPPD
jgi:hypothetical protein